MTSMVRILAAATLPITLLFTSPGQAQRYGDVDGRWALVGDPSGCNGNGAFDIQDGTLTFAGGQPFNVVLTGFTLQVIPPEDCDDCRTVPFDVMPDGTLQRFIDGTTEIYRPCPAGSVEAAAATQDLSLAIAATPALEAAPAEVTAPAEPTTPVEPIAAEAPVPEDTAAATAAEPMAEDAAAAEPQEAAEPEDAAAPETPTQVAAVEPVAEPEQPPEAEPERWSFRQFDSTGEAFLDTAQSRLVVGCERTPVPTVYLKYYPEPSFRFPIVEGLRGRFNLMLATIHARWGIAQTPYLFDASLEEGRAVYTYRWSGTQTFFTREQAYMAVAALRTSAIARIQSLTLGDDRRPTYQDEIELHGSGEAIANAMQAGGCTGFLAAVGRAIEEGEIIP